MLDKLKKIDYKKVSSKIKEVLGLIKYYFKNLFFLNTLKILKLAIFIIVIILFFKI
tara:strand:- start:1325 stop:1492 length:168 start_codon:yes stop_codon:yes gene_type:complete